MEATQGFARDNGRRVRQRFARHCSVFNLVSGLLAMLMADVIAGVLWDQMGSRFTFYAGALFCLLALLTLAPKLQYDGHERCGHRTAGR